MSDRVQPGRFLWGASGNARLHDGGTAQTPGEDHDPHLACTRPAPTRPEIREPDDPAHLGFLQSAYAHIMGRTAYEAIAGSMTTSTDHPFALS